MPEEDSELVSGTPITPRRVGPFVVCGCLGDDLVENMACHADQTSEKCNRIYLQAGEMLASILGGNRYIIVSIFSHLNSLPPPFVPKFIGAVLARIGRLYHPDDRDKNTDDLGEFLDRKIDDMHRGRFFQEILHQPLPGKTHIMFYGMTRDHEKNSKPNSYFANFTENVSNILVHLFHGPEVNYFL